MNVKRIFSISYLIVALLWSASSLEAQEHISLEALAKSLNKALIDRNENQLNQLLHDDLTYGHSNGWVENKKELLDNNRSKYIIYEQIDIDSFTEVHYKKSGIVRFQSTTKLILDGKILSLTLHVCQTWVKVKGHWKLLARQSAKLG